MPPRPLPRRPSADEDAEHIVNGLRRVVRAIELYSQEVYRSYGLTAPQLWALKTLARRGPLTTSELAEALAVQPSTLSLLVDRLEGRRLVRRERGRDDRRFVTVSLTPRGRDLAAQAPEPAQGRLLHGLRRLGPGRRQQIRRAVGTLVQLMEAADVEARFFFAEG